MKRNNLCGYTQYAADKLSSVTNLVLPKSCVNSIDIQQFLFGQSTVADLDASRPTQSSRPTFRSCSRSVRKRHQPTAYQQHTWYARPRDHALSAELVCDMLAFSADFNVAIADGLPNFLVDCPRRLPGRQLPRASQDDRRSCSRGARPPLILYDCYVSVLICPACCRLRHCCFNTPPHLPRWLLLLSFLP